MTTDISNWFVLAFFVAGLVGMAVFYTMCEYRVGWFKNDV